MKRTSLLASIVLLAFSLTAFGEEAAEADYKKLGFANDRITNDGQPYTGVAIKKDKQGNKRARYIYKEGLLHGLVEEWYADGKKSTECTFVNNQRNGTNTYWKTDGTLMKRQIWKDGKLVESTDKADLETPAP